MKFLSIFFPFKKNDKNLFLLAIICNDFMESFLKCDKWINKIDYSNKVIVGNCEIKFKSKLNNINSINLDLLKLN